MHFLKKKISIKGENGQKCCFFLLRGYPPEGDSHNRALCRKCWKILEKQGYICYNKKKRNEGVFMGAYGSPELLPDNSNNSQDVYTKNMIYCMYCGFKYSKKLKKCPQCGKKHSQPFYHKWWFWIIALIMVVNIFSSPNINESSNTVSDVDSEQVVISPEEYKASCGSIAYKDIARNPNNYIGQKVVFNGKVIQVQESGKRVVLRVNVSKGEYGMWDDTVYIDYQKKDENESRVLEEDIITMYGEIKGIKDYTAVLGNQISIPHIKAEYIDIN